MSSVYALPLYSKLRRAVENSPMEAAPFKAWCDWLSSLDTKGVSLYELDCFCISAPEDGRLTRQQVLDQMHQLESEIVVRINLKPKPRRLVMESFHQAGVRSIPLGERKVLPRIVARNRAYDFNLAYLGVDDLLEHKDVWVVLNGKGMYWRSSRLRQLPEPVFHAQEEALDWCRYVSRRLIPNVHRVLEPSVQWDEVRLRGGEGYAEWLITLPHHSFFELFNPRQHFDCNRLLMHLRTSIYKVGDRRILLIEELQSDYLQNRRNSPLKDEMATYGTAYDASWVDLGLRVAVLIAARQGLDGVATSTGRMHDVIYDRENKGRASFYDNRVSKALQRLGKSLGVAVGQSRISAKTQCVQVFELESRPSRPALWAVSKTRNQLRSTQVFREYQEAVAYAESQEDDIDETVPTLWLDGQHRRLLNERGLPTLGAVDRLLDSEVALPRPKPDVSRGRQPAGEQGDVWIPTTAPRDLWSVLAVFCAPGSEMTPSRHRSLLESKVEKLVRRADGHEKRMACALLPDLDLAPPKGWAALVMYSDQMAAACAVIRWEAERPASDQDKAYAKGLLQTLTLSSLLEQF